MIIFVRACICLVWHLEGHPACNCIDNCIEPTPKILVTLIRGSSAQSVTITKTCLTHATMDRQNRCEVMNYYLNIIIIGSFSWPLDSFSLVFCNSIMALFHALIHIVKILQKRCYRVSSMISAEPQWNIKNYWENGEL